jgi:hypothetical protein
MTPHSSSRWWRFGPPVLAAALVVGMTALLSGVARTAPPEVPSTADITSRMAAVQQLPLPAADPMDEDAVYVGIAAEERALTRNFLELQEALPAWSGEGIIVAAGSHRLEAVAEALARPDLLDCAAALCRVQAPLAVEAGAMLIVDGLTVELEQDAGSAIVAFGDLFVSGATIEGRDGTAPATTDGEAFRPFIIAYDASRTVIRDSRLAALGFDLFGTTGLAVMTLSRDDPAGHPELDLVGTLIEDLFDGVFVRGGARVEVLRNTITTAGRHGIVVRDGTANVLIAENVVTGSGAMAENGNGIVVSREARDAVVMANRVEGSAASGILVERAATGLAISGNELRGNGRDGLIIYESGDIDVLGNGIVASGRSGIRVRASDGVRIMGNVLEGNARAGVDAHDWSGAAREPNDEERPLIRPTEVTVTGNRFADNQRGPCLFEGAVTVLPVDGSDC